MRYHLHWPGGLGNVQTLEHKGSSNVMVSFKEDHFRRMGTLIAMLDVIKEGGDFSALPLDPALILKCKKPKVILNPHNLLVNTNRCAQCQLHEGSFCTLIETSIGQNKC